MNSDELLAFCRALPPSVTRIRFFDSRGEIEIEQRPAPPLVPVSLSAEQLEAAHKAAAAKLKPRDTDSLNKPGPPNYVDG